MALEAAGVFEKEGTASCGACEKSSTPPVNQRLFLKAKILDVEEHNRVSRLLTVCAECGDDLVLSRSGHHLCANRRCKDGFDVRPDLRLMTLVSLLTEEKKLL